MKQRQVVAGLFLALGLGITETVHACWTPLEWQKKPVQWNRDKNKDSIDDGLDRLIQDKPQERVAVVLDLSRCAGPKEMAELATFGTVLKRGKFVTFVAMEVAAGKIPELAKLPMVALVEQMHGFSPVLDISGDAIKVTHSTTYPNNLEDVVPTLRGLGRTLAFIDSGLDNQGGPGTTHDSMPAWKFAGGYDAQTLSFTDPDDTLGHGTHVAGIAVGTGAGTGYRGMAPDVSLVDCGTSFQCGPNGWLEVVDCFEQILLNAAAWSVDVLNVSMRQCDVFQNTISTDGTDAASRLANHLVARGITVVAAAGNDGPGNTGLTPPCAADNAICVGAMNDLGTVTRSDDQIAPFSSRGPRANDGDLDGSDETKPDVTAPGTNIRSTQMNTTNGYVDISGTSMATPHVSGVAILIGEAKPGINPGSIKHLLINTAEDWGPAGWDPAHGHGYIDAFQAIAAVSNADPGYPGAGTYPEPWLCSDVSTASSPQVGVPNTVYAMVRNNTSVPANNVKVTFGVYIYSAGIPEFFSIGAQTISLPPFSPPVQVAHPWTPQPSGTNDPHACLQTTIDYGFDTNFTNNQCNRNIQVNQTNSPAYFTFQVQNTLVEPARIVLEAAPATKFPDTLEGTDTYKILPGERIFAPARWDHALTRNAVELEPGDCPVTVTLRLNLADDAKPVDGAVFNVPGLAVTPGGQRIVLDGITAYGHPPCPAAWGGDQDGDAVCGAFDTCGEISNPEQIDADGDGLGDLCDPDPYTSRYPQEEERCRAEVASGSLAAHRAYTCLDEVKAVLSGSIESLEASDETADPVRDILVEKLGVAQIELCRARHSAAASRLQAFDSQLSILSQIRSLSLEEATQLSVRVKACEAKVPESISRRKNEHS